MKLKYTLALLLLSVLQLSAQTIQRGKVVLQNSGHKPLSGVQMTAYGAQPTDTDNDGAFRLNFNKAESGDLAPLKEAYKKGYELVNKKETEKWILSDAKDMIVVMCPEGALREARESYYQIGAKTYVQRYENALAELEKQKEANRLTEKEYADKLEATYNELESSQKLLYEYADLFSRINKDDLNELETEAFRLLGEGELDKAIGLYENEKLFDKLNKQIQIKDAATTEINEMIPSLKRYAEICIFAGGKENIDKASEIYKIIAESDLNNFRNLQEYGLFLQKQSDYPGSAEWLKAALKVAGAKPEIAEIQRVLGETYILQKDYNQAELYFTNSAQIYDALAKESAHFMQNKASIFCNLGVLYWSLNNFQKASEVLSFADEYNEIVVEDSIIYLDNKTNIHGLRGLVGLRQMQMFVDDVDQESTLIDLEEATRTCRDLVERDSAKYITVLRNVLSNLAVFYQVQADFEKAETTFKYLLELNESIYELNPELGIVELGTVYSNIGKLYLAMKDYDKALAFFTKSLDIRKDLAEKNPNAFLSALAVSYNNIGTLYSEIPDYENAIDFLTKAITIQEELAKQYPESYVPGLVTSYSNLVAFFGLYEDISNMKKYTQKAVDVKALYPGTELEMIVHVMKTILTSLAFWLNDPQFPEYRNELRTVYKYDDQVEAIYWYNQGLSNEKYEGNPKKTEAYFKQSLLLYESAMKEGILSNERAAAEFCQTMGNFFYKNDQDDLALDCYNFLDNFVTDPSILEGDEDMLLIYSQAFIRKGDIYGRKKQWENYKVSSETARIYMRYLDQIYPEEFKKLMQKLE